MTVHFDKIDTDYVSSSSPIGLIAAERRPGLYRNVFKRLVDIAAILISAPIAVPAIAVLAMIVARDGHAPFFWSSRVGKHGRNFSMLKLRSMVPDAEDLLDKHLARDVEARIEWDSTQKLKNDPRITKFGRFLRKTSLDELPQLWNVLIGDMSLVGPRPMLPAQRVMYPGLAYFALRPGITGPWQVSDRNESEFTKRADHDRDYDETLTFSGDVKFLLQTLSVVVRGTGY